MSTYSDISLYVTRYTTDEVVTEYESINQNLFLMILTPIGSKWRSPRVGTNVVRYLFDPMDKATSDKIKIDIRSVFIRNKEPRVTIQNVDVVADQDTQSYIVTITYVAVQIGDSPYVLRFALNSQT